MRKTFLVAALGMVAAAAAAGGWYWWSVARFFESTDNAYIQSDVSVVSPQVEGYVRDVLVTDNQAVRAGDVLVRIQDRDFRAKLAEAAATVEAQKAAVGSIDSKTALQHSLIEQAAATVTSAQAELDRAQQDYARFKRLLTNDFVSRQKFESADADRRKAQAELARATAAAAAEKDQLVVLAAARHEAEAKLAEAEAALTLARNDLDYTVIRAPVDGVVGNKGAQVGQYVRPGTQLLSVVPLRDIYIVANFKETQLGRMRPGQPVDIEVDAFSSRKLTGRVESFAPASGSQFSLLPPENATGNFTKIVQRVPVRIAVPAGNVLSGLLRPGLSVVVSVDTRNEGTGPRMVGGIFGAAPAAAATTAEAAR